MTPRPQPLLFTSASQHSHSQGSGTPKQKVNKSCSQSFPWSACQHSDDDFCCCCWRFAAAQRPTNEMMRYQQRSSRKRERDPDDDERLFFLGMTRRSQLGMSCDCDLVKRLEADIDAARKKLFLSFFLSLHPDLKSFRLFSISLCFVQEVRPTESGHCDFVWFRV